ARQTKSPSPYPSPMSAWERGPERAAATCDSRGGNAPRNSATRCVAAIHASKCRVRASDPPRQSGDGVGQIGGLDGLWNVILETRGEGPGAVFASRERRQRQGRDGTAVAGGLLHAADAADQRVAV